jgi:arginase
MPTTARPVVIVGSPTALGGHFGGMERTPAGLRRLGLLDRLREADDLADVSWVDAGDARNEPGWVADDDRRAKNRERISAFLPRLADHLDAGLRAAGPEARALILGGDCTSHAGALAGVRRARPGSRLGLVWFDAHGDFNTPDTTPSGNVWGMPFAMICGRGDADLLAACDGPSVREEDAALAGGQVLDETESRTLAASAVAHFGAGMLATDAGRAALGAWAAVVAARVDAWYIAVDLDAIDASEGLAVAMPEPDGLSLDATVMAIEAIAASGPVLAVGITAAMFDEAGRDGGQDEGRDGPADVTVRAVTRLSAAALGRG